MTSAATTNPEGASAAARRTVTETAASPSPSPSAPVLLTSPLRTADVTEPQVPAVPPDAREAKPAPAAETPVAVPPPAAVPASSSVGVPAPTASAMPALEPTPAAPLLVPLPMLAVDVWNADERYFSATGATPEEIVSSAMANVPADQTGADRSTMVYVGPIAWDHRPSYVHDPATGSCTMTGLSSSVAYQATVPQWTGQASVAPELIEWWVTVLEHIREHESHHIEIYERYVAELPGRVTGQPCGSWDAIIGEWSSEIASAHAAFDADESHWQLPPYAGSSGG